MLPRIAHDTNRLTSRPRLQAGNGCQSRTDPRTRGMHVLVILTEASNASGAGFWPPDSFASAKPVPGLSRPPEAATFAELARLADKEHAAIAGEGDEHEE